MVMLLVQEHSTWEDSAILEPHAICFFSPFFLDLFYFDIDVANYSTWPSRLVYKDTKQVHRRGYINMGLTARIGPSLPTPRH